MTELITFKIANGDYGSDNGIIYADLSDIALSCILESGLQIQHYCIVKGVRYCISVNAYDAIKDRLIQYYENNGLKQFDFTGEGY